ncbi:MAG: hypothetical protein H6739_16150 [Alphaproteobacteria bacterium]|nr:hypothetical protein [Alphaproteobacteria bacterium]
MHLVLSAILPGRRPRSVWGLPFPAWVRVVLGLSFILARPLCWVVARGPLSRSADALVQRMEHHPSAALRGLLQWWKLVALTTADPPC